MDLTFENAVTFRLVEGNGPIHIVAEQIVGVYTYIYHSRFCFLCFFFRHNMANKIFLHMEVGLRTLYHV